MSEPARLLSLDARFEVGELLGEGGMGAVYLAWDRVLERPVALKFIRGADPTLAERLLLEARLQARVEHANIGKVYEVGEHQGRPCIALQLIRGKSLEQLAPGLSLNERVRLLKQIAEGVHAAHLTGLVHRDIKPANFLVEIEGESRTAYVTDFGLARGPSPSGLSHAGVPAGTLAFMSPEQAAAEGPIDFRSDLYSLGASLYSLLVFRPPFVSGKASQAAGIRTPQDTDSLAGFYGLFGSTGEAAQVGLLRKVIEEDPPSPRSIDKKVPRDLETIALRCLNKNPGSRYSNAAALAADLGRYLEGKSIVARPPGFLERTARFISKHRAAALALVAVLIVAAAAVGVNARNSAQAAALQVERDAILQRFDQTMLDAIYRLRLAHMAPLHDRHPQVQALRESIASVTADMERLGPIAEGSGHRAIGLGLLAIDDYRGAIEHLEKAWTLGVRSPESAEALGWALYLFHAQESGHLFTAPPGEVKDRKAKLEQMKSRALEVLATYQGKGETPFSAPLRAQFRGETEAALEGARKVLVAEPWYERAIMLIVRIRARSSAHARTADDWERALAESEAAVSQLVQIEPSNPSSWHEAWLFDYTQVTRAAEPEQRRALLQRGTIAARNGTIADPGNPRALTDLSGALFTLAQLKLDQGISPLAEVAEGLEVNSRSRAAMALQSVAVSYLNAALMHSIRALWDFESGDLAGADQAVREFDSDIADGKKNDPANSWAVQTAEHKLDLATGLLLAGRDPRPLIESGQADLKLSKGVGSGESIAAYVAQADAMLAVVAQDHGEPAAALLEDADTQLKAGEDSGEKGSRLKTAVLLAYARARPLPGSHAAPNARETLRTALATGERQGPGDPAVLYVGKKTRELHLLAAK